MLWRGLWPRNPVRSQRVRSRVSRVMCQSAERDAQSSAGRSTSIALHRHYGTILTSAASKLPANIVLPVGMMTAAAGSDTGPAASPNAVAAAATVPLTFASLFEEAISE